MGRDAAVILSMRVVGAALWMVYTVVLARTLSEADFTVAVYIINFSMTAVLLITLGRDVSLVRFASKAWAAGANTKVRIILGSSRSVITINGAILTALLVCAALYGFRSPVTTSVFAALMTGLITLFSAQMGINRDCLRSIGMVWQSQLGLNLTRSVVPILGSMIILTLGSKMSLDLALLLFLSSLAFSLVIDAVFLGKIDWRKEGDEFEFSLSSHSKAGWVLWPGDIANAVMMRSVGLIGALVLPPETAALLLAAERVAGLAQFPIGATSQAAAPQIARATNARNPSLLQAELYRASSLMLFGAGAGTSAVFVLAWPALWALGLGFLAALPATLILASAGLAWGVFGLAQMTLNLIGMSRLYSVISIAMAALMAVAIWYFARSHGLLGAALTWTFGWWIANCVYTLALWKTTGLKTGLFAFVKSTEKPNQ